MRHSQKEKPSGDVPSNLGALADFGEYLRGERQLRKVALVDVAGATKVPLQTLQALEDGAWNELPAAVFVRGFVRSYAKCVGLPASEVRERYENARRSAEEEIDARIDGDPQHEGNRPFAPTYRGRFGLALFLLIVLILATLTLSILWRGGGGLDVHAETNPADRPTDVLPS